MLTGLRSLAMRTYATHDFMLEFAAAFNVPVVRRLPNLERKATLAKLQNVVVHKEGKEGVVLRHVNGTMLKIKTGWYWKRYHAQPPTAGECRGSKFDHGAHRQRREKRMRASWLRLAVTGIPSTVSPGCIASYFPGWDRAQAHRARSHRTARPRGCLVRTHLVSTRRGEPLYKRVVAAR